MSLIIMPTDADFHDTGVITNYAGRVLALNLDKRKVYQTVGFYLGPARPFATVPPSAALDDIRDAVLRGDLIDVTGTPGRGVVSKGGSMSPIHESVDPDARTIFIGTMPTSSDAPQVGATPLFIAVPKSAEEEVAMLEEINRTGRIDGKYTDALVSAPGISFTSLTVSDIDYSKTPKKYPSNSYAESSWSLMRKSFRAMANEVLTFLHIR